jgi:thiol-disulfide isomerase/thioredoxin
LEIAQWVKGGPVRLADGKGKNLYVIEFWATWCPPCRVSVPHLTELQKKFKDQGVIIIGISDETAEKVKPFVEKMGDKMDYVVALDRGGKMGEAYMKAFEQDGIPHAFVVDKESRIVWNGHPMSGLEQALEQLVAGKFDLEAAKRAARAEQSMGEYFRLVSGEQLSDRAAALGKQIVDNSAANPGALNEFAWTVLTAPRVKHRDLDLALRAAKQAYDSTEGKDPSITDTYARALFDQGRVEEAIRYQKAAIAGCTDPQMRSQLERTLKGYEAKTAPR